MQVFFEIGPEIRKFQWLNIFKIAVMDATIFEALWRHIDQIKYAKQNYKGFSRIVGTNLYIDVLL